MKYLYLFLLLLLAFIPSCSNSTEPIELTGEWYLLSDQQSDASYSSIFFIDEMNGWIGGRSNRIKKTTDGGKSWISLNIGIIKDIWDIHFIDRNNGWACGTNCAIIKTTDGGSTWTNLSTAGPENKVCLSIKFLSESNGWMMSNYGQVLKTTDGGVNWTVMKQLREMGALLSVIDNNTVYVYQRELYRTFNGGISWDSHKIDIPEYNEPLDIHFHNSLTGLICSTSFLSSVAVASSYALTTTDGGSSWKAFPVPNFEWLSCCFMVNENIGWVAANNIYLTVNGGSSWELVYSLNDGHLLAGDMYFVSPNCGWLLTVNGKIYKFG